MKRSLVLAVASACILAALSCAIGSQSAPATETPDVSFSGRSQEYTTLRDRIVARHGGRIPREWGEAVAGVKNRLKGGDKVVALTFDACGSPRGKEYDAELIDFLEGERIPATLFVSGLWIEANPALFRRLAANPLFEIANHGDRHRPASIMGRKAYGIAGSRNVGELVDEIELNARRINEITGRRPAFYRSGTAHYDETAVEVAAALGHRVAGFSLLGDAGATYTADQVRNALLNARSGDIAILHMNHPGSGTAGGVKAAVPELRKRGFRFVKLSEAELE